MGNLQPKLEQQFASGAQKDDRPSAGINNDCSSPRKHLFTFVAIHMRNNANALEDRLRRRPSEEELLKAHVLKGGNVSLAIVEAQAALQRALTEDVLNQLLRDRTAPNELVESNILHSTSAAHAVQQARDALELAIKRDVLLKRKLEQRQGPEELKHRNIIHGWLHLTCESDKG